MIVSFLGSWNCVTSKVGINRSVHVDKEDVGLSPPASNCLLLVKLANVQNLTEKFKNLCISSSIHCSLVTGRLGRPILLVEVSVTSY